MKLSKIIEKVEEWFRKFTYNYFINSIIPDTKYKYKISITEICPNGERDFFIIYADDKGNLYNGLDNLVELGQEAYCDDEDMIQWLKDFEEKWRE